MHCNAVLFPGNPVLSLVQGGAVVPLACNFIGQDNFLAWHKLFTNLYD